MIRVGTEEAKAGDTWSFCKLRPKTVQGQVPKLTDGDAAAADALLKAAGLVSGTVTYEYDPSKPHGQVLSQSELPGTMLEPQSAVDYVVNDSAQASTEAAAAKTGEEEKYYVGSIDATCSLSNYIGPASQTSSVRILIRLKQKDPKDANTYVYTNLISPRLVVGSQDIPVVFSRIKGAYGVDSGIVEVVDVDNDDKVIQSWPVSFFPSHSPCAVFLGKQFGKLFFIVLQVARHTIEFQKYHLFQRISTDIMRFIASATISAIIGTVEIFNGAVRMVDVVVRLMTAIRARRRDLRTK